eukprot:1023325-Prorocentrum_minimum.AAC.2
MTDRFPFASRGRRTPTLKGIKGIKGVKHVKGVKGAHRGCGRRWGPPCQQKSSSGSSSALSRRGLSLPAPPPHARSSPASLAHPSWQEHPGGGH